MQHFFSNSKKRVVWAGFCHVFDCLITVFVGFSGRMKKRLEFFLFLTPTRIFFRMSFPYRFFNQQGACT